MVTFTIPRTGKNTTKKWHYFTTIVTFSMSMGGGLTIACASGEDTAEIENVPTGTLSQALSAPWAEKDIGTTGAAGSVITTPPDLYEIKGSGADIYGTSDAFHFVYQAIKGDVTLVAQVSSVQNTNSWAKAGVMIRESLNPNSKEMMVALTPGNGVTSQKRTSTSATTSVTSGGSARAPYYVKLARSGSTITTYRSSNGTTWTKIESATFNMAASAYIGLAVTSHSRGTLCDAKFKIVSLTTSPGTCSTGYHDGGDGTCVPNGTCSSGYHDGGNGTCVIAGSCSLGYHDGGNGTCLATGTCSSGYHDNGSGSCVANKFANGPCIVSPNLADVEVFASSGEKIYRRVVSGTNTGSWASIAGLDPTYLDILSDLDCTSNSSTVHIAATGSAKSGALGSYMHARGFGTTYGAFTRELSTYTPATYSTPGASIATWTTVADSRYQMAAVSGLPYWYFYQSDTMTTSISPPGVSNSLTSAPDIALQQTNDPSHFEMVAFDSGGMMVYYDLSWGYSSWWEPNLSVPPPSATTYQYSPTICTHTDPATSDYRRHVAAVASGKLYYAYSEKDWTNGSTLSAWELVGNVVPGSSPDCVVTADNTVHIVVLTSTGSVAEVHRSGTTGSWTATDLGEF